MARGGGRQCPPGMDAEKKKKIKDLRRQRKYRLKFGDEEAIAVLDKKIQAIFDAHDAATVTAMGGSPGGSRLYRRSARR